MTVTFDFHDRHVLVTGGSNGLGLAMARGFHTAGAQVTITGRRESAEQYDEDLSGFRYVRCEMTDRAMISDLASGLDRLDVLVNNAGQNLVGRGEWDPDVFEEALTINLSGAFRLSTACHDLLAASPGGGSVINLGSMTSFLAVDLVPGYGAAKAGVVQLTKTLATAWAKDGIRVNAVAPGLIETSMTAKMVANDAAVAPTIARTPMRRVGTPEDIAPVVMFLASGAAPFLTGQTIAVDGGFLIQG
ncbi:SDR family NAD(P)-dependent oxidoreductase [Sphaerimonospora thailandensis]|uniref:Short-chain dehydrogenase n=1 Tax=Sphaerimonospora thailandensis TaxID=795644 RepID=A0A8J3VXM5_9ACTN|nr:SDR family oxidoreductase [Sphaerimonospora thailandensis]GIH68045.1 short-chain dehydrogenase [Sphaerimonospora thailandensis]